MNSDRAVNVAAVILAGAAALYVAYLNAAHMAAMAIF